MSTTINLGKVVPEKGVDYYTDAEAQEFKTQITSELDERITTNANNITTLKSVTGTTTDTFSTESTYSVGDIVIKDHKYYRCKTAITTAGAWDSSKWDEINVRQELDEKETRIQELEESNKLIISNYDTGVATGDELEITDALNGYNQGIAVCGNTTQDTSKRTYVCAGTESGNYYFTYDNINYQFTMPTVSTGDVLVFDTTTQKLYLGETEITTTTDNTGTLITLSATPNPNFAVDIVDVTGTQEVVVSSKNLFDENGNFHYSTNASGVTSVSSGWSSTDYIKCDEGDCFVQSGITRNTGDITYRMVFFDKDKNYISRPLADRGTIGVQSNYVRIAPQGAEYVMAQFRKNGSYNNQFEPGTTDTDYAPHKGLTATLHLGDIHLRKIGNYQDKIYNENGKWWLYTAIGLSSITTGWVKVADGKFYRSLSGRKRVETLCNQFKWDNRTSGFANMPDGYFGLENNAAAIHVTDMRFSTAAEYSAYTTENPVNVLLPLATPTDTEITLQNYPELYADLQELLKIQTYREHTIIQVTPAEGNTGNPAQIELTYLKDDRVSKEDFELLKARVDLLEE